MSEDSGATNRVENAQQASLLTHSDQEIYPSSSQSPSSSSSSKSKRNSNKKKIRGQKLEAPQSRLKHLRVHLKEDYRLLFNDTVNSLNEEPSFENSDQLSSSQIGITSWSPEEKAVFFQSLVKKGRNNLPGIAAAIGTKTELEVQVYLLLLQKSVAKQYLEGRSRHFFDISEITGAYEVSQNCSAELELAADALSAMQEREDHKLEIKRNKELWLLTPSIARWVERCHNDGGKGANEVQDRLPAAELLNLRKFLKLSESIFMNSSVEDNNWRRYCAHARPSILYSAFADIHRLALSITRRLIQSIIFFALSRLRTTTQKNYKPQRAVRRQDVAAALNVLGMSHNSRDFWVRTARKCKLTVYLSPNSKFANDKPLTYEAVEKALSTGYDSGESFLDVAAREQNGPDAVFQPTIPSWHSIEEDLDRNTSDCLSDNSVHSSLSEGSSPISISQNNGKRRLEGQDVQDDSDDDMHEETYLEALDQKASQYEEQRLWKLLGKETPDSIKPEELRLPKRPLKKRKLDDDLGDWRSWLKYVPEWETYETPIPASKFAENRKTRQNANHTFLSSQTNSQHQHHHHHHHHISSKSSTSASGTRSTSTSTSTSTSSNNDPSTDTNEDARNDSSSENDSGSSSRSPNSRTVEVQEDSSTTQELGEVGVEDANESMSESERESESA